MKPTITFKNGWPVDWKYKQGVKHIQQWERLLVLVNEFRLARIERGSV